jgi:hypothetical protein
MVPTVSVRVRTWSAVLVLAAAGCGGSLLEETKEEFNAGEYADAKRTLLRIDQSVYRASDARMRTTYALYRGLVMGALGSRTEATAWLGLAKQTEERYPGSLGPDDVARLKLAEEQYGPLLPTTAPLPAE